MTTAIPLKCPTPDPVKTARNRKLAISNSKVGKRRIQPTQKVSGREEACLIGAPATTAGRRTPPPTRRPRSSTMTEAKAKRSRHKTIDGGPPSQDQVAIQIEIFDPRQALVEDADDDLRMTAVAEAAKRVRRSPAPLCATCDTEFSHGEWPAALYCLRALTLKSQNVSTLGGMICRQCVKRSPNELINAVANASRAERSRTWSPPRGRRDRARRRSRKASRKVGKRRIFLRSPKVG